MEKDMRDTSKWKRSVGIILGGKMFIDMSGEFNEKNYLNQKMKYLQEELEFMGIKPSNNADNKNKRVQPPTGIFVFFWSLIFRLEFNFVIYSAKYFLKHLEMITL